MLHDRETSTCFGEKGNIIELNLGSYSSGWKCGSRPEALDSAMLLWQHCISFRHPDAYSWVFSSASSGPYFIL